VQGEFPASSAKHRHLNARRDRPLPAPLRRILTIRLLMAGQHTGIRQHQEFFSGPGSRVFHVQGRGRTARSTPPRRFHFRSGPVGTFEQQSPRNRLGNENRTPLLDDLPAGCMGLCRFGFLEQGPAGSRSNRLSRRNPPSTPSAGPAADRRGPWRRWAAARWRRIPTKVIEFGRPSAQRLTAPSIVRNQQSAIREDSIMPPRR